MEHEAKPKMRDGLYFFAGAAGLGLLQATAKWLEQLVPARERKEKSKRPSVWRGWGENKTVHMPVQIFAMDTDPLSEGALSQIKESLARIDIPVQYIRVEGPTAGQDPISVYKRLESSNGLKSEIDRVIAENTYDPSKYRGIFYASSLHGSGAAINVYIADYVIPKLAPSAELRLMTAVIADVTKFRSPLDYYRSTAWALNNIDRLLDENKLDGVITLDNTLLTAMASVLKGLASMGDIEKAFEPVMTLLDRGKYDLNDLVLAYRDSLYQLTSSVSKVDPAESNELMVKAVAPLVYFPTFGPALGKEVFSQSSPWDLMNMKRSIALEDTNNPTRRAYLKIAVLPGELIRKINPDSIEDLMYYLSISFLAPINIRKVQRLMVIVGDDVRASMGTSGVAFTSKVIETLKQKGYYGDIEVLLVKNCNSAWLIAVQEGEALLRGIYGINSTNVAEGEGERA